MQYVEYLLRHIKMAEEIAVALREQLDDVVSTPFNCMARDLADAGVPSDEAGKVLRAVDQAREAAWHQVNALTTELEVLHAAADDVVGKVGRLV
jgi:hypothetical protein